MKLTPTQQTVIDAMKSGLLLFESGGTRRHGGCAIVRKVADPRAWGGYRHERVSTVSRRTVESLWFGKLIVPPVVTGTGYWGLAESPRSSGMAPTEQAGGE